MRVELGLRALLMRERERMRCRRFRRELMSIYADNLCPICGGRHMTGGVCRRYRGCVCERHCLSCEFHEPMFWQCRFREREPVDMRKWRMVCSANAKAELWEKLYRYLWMRDDPRTMADARMDGRFPRGIRADAEAAVSGCAEPRYLIADEADADGFYAVTEAATGALLPYAALLVPGTCLWVCVEFLPPEG